MNTARFSSVVRFTLVVGILCLTALLLPADVQPTLGYTKGHASPHAQALAGDCYGENSLSPDEVVPQGKWQKQECHARLLPFLLAVSLQAGAVRPPARPPVLVAIHPFPRKIPPRPALDDPFPS